jgi:hypothetical protein
MSKLLSSKTLHSLGILGVPGKTKPLLGILGVAEKNVPLLGVLGVTEKKHAIPRSPGSGRKRVSPL